MYKCKNHIINVLPGNYTITDYNACNSDNNYSQFIPLLCKKCGREDRIIYSQGLCKPCYYIDKQYESKTPRKYNYQLRPKKKNTERTERIKLIKELKQQGKTFTEIGRILGLSKQRVNYIHNKNKGNSE
jgi:DNA-directed RNA polymerase specialized sigma subunit